MVIRESTSPSLELDLSGSVKELQDIANVLYQIRTGETCRFAADSAADPLPYERCLEVFTIQATEGPVRLTVEKNVLHATGSPELLAKFASFFEFSVNHWPGAHAHYEWYEGGPITAEGSRPLVVSVTE